MFDLHVERIVNEREAKCFKVKCPIATCNWAVYSMDSSKGEDWFTERALDNIYNHLTVARSHINSYREQEQWLLA